jgi:RNA polymerase sigma-70 factor, ECF subfamily
VNVGSLVDHLFRRSAGQMVAALTRSLGPACLHLAEEAVQEALVRALETWPYRGVPDDPQAWLFRVARNHAVDGLRRSANLDRKLAVLGDIGVAELRAEVADAELSMVFMCCHPALSREAQVMLTLKTVGGFSTAEIAAAFLAEVPAVAQRLVRAKRILAAPPPGAATAADPPGPFVMPAGAALCARTDVVLDVLYLMFNEGYAAHSGAELVRRELCQEAIRLLRLVCADERTRTPTAHALLALMLLQSSRLDTRTDARGELVLLDEQDRSTWNNTLIADGMHHLDESASGSVLSRFHVQAAIAAVHAVAPDAAATDWSRILQLYDQLMQIAPSPVVALNRAVAVARVHGSDAALHEMRQLADDASLRRYFPYPAVLGSLWLDAGRPDEATVWYGRARELASNAAERRFVERRLAACSAQLELPPPG